MIPSSKVQHILFITSSRIGDAVLSSGLLNYMHSEYPNAKFTISCGPLAVSLFEGFPNLERILPLKKQKYNKHWIGLWRNIIGTRFDIVVDLRNSAVSRLIRVQHRYIYGSYVDKKLHKVEQNASVMRLSGAPPSPKLWFSEAQREKATSLIPDGEGLVLGVGPTANWLGKTWPEERFIEVVRWLTSDDGLMAGARVAVFAAPGEEEAARVVLDSVPKQLDVIAKTDPGTAAATIARCDFYIGNDSGLMHCAAAAGVPTFGVFGPSYPHIYRPWGDNAAYASTPESFDALIDYDGYSAQTAGCLMTSLSVDMVKTAIEKSWSHITSSS